MKYGKNEICSVPPDFDYLGQIQSKTPMGEGSEEKVILEALENPIGSGKLREIVKPGEKICIVISDTTRTWQKMDLY
ncbi:MAG: lactate racemase domain-containing protein, partial [Pseudomonadota bacterium]